MKNLNEDIERLKLEIKPETNNIKYFKKYNDLSDEEKSELINCSKLKKLETLLKINEYLNKNSNINKNKQELLNLVIKNNPNISKLNLMITKYLLGFIRRDGNMFIKFMNNNDIHYDMQYKTGLNVDVKSFNTNVQDNGLYFTDLNGFDYFKIKFGVYLRIVTKVKTFYKNKYYIENNIIKYMNDFYYDRPVIDIISNDLIMINDNGIIRYKCHGFILSERMLISDFYKYYIDNLNENTFNINFILKNYNNEISIPKELYDTILLNGINYNLIKYIKKDINLSYEQKLFIIYNFPIEGYYYLNDKSDEFYEIVVSFSHINLVFVKNTTYKTFNIYKLACGQLLQNNDNSSIQLLEIIYDNIIYNMPDKFKTN